MKSKQFYFSSGSRGEIGVAEMKKFAAIYNKPADYFLK